MLVPFGFEHLLLWFDAHDASLDLSHIALVEIPTFFYILLLLRMRSAMAVEGFDRLRIGMQRSLLHFAAGECGRGTVVRP